MHQRTWLSLITLPVVTTFTYPVLVRPTDPPKVEAKSTLQDPLAGLSDIQDVLALVRDNYVDAPDMGRVISGGIQGTLERVHPLNAYISPEELRLPDPGSADPGLTLRKSQIYAQVIAVASNGPAAKAGVQVGDVVRKLDGQSIGIMSAWTLERRLRGAEGSELSLLWYDSSVGSAKKITLKRENPTRLAIAIRKDLRATVLALPDLGAGRVLELRSILASLDGKLPLILDLRRCAGGDLVESAKIAGLFLGKAPYLTLQEAGKADRILETSGEKGSVFVKVAVLTGFGTVGPAEALAAALKKQVFPSFGERTAGMGAERTRFLLRQGGAVELVNKRWLGAGGEKLDRQGLVPEFILRSPRFERGVATQEDLLPRILEQLDKKLEPKPEPKAHLKAGLQEPWLRSLRLEPQGRTIV
jgi:carboxyl-terminal processing protease